MKTETVLIIILLVIAVVVVTVMMMNRNNSKLGSELEDKMVDQTRVLELKSELERIEASEREEIEALRQEMRMLEKENAKNVLTLEKELIASGLKGKAAEDALRKELEDMKRAEQVKVDTIQLHINKVKAQETAIAKLKSELAAANKQSSSLLQDMENINTDKIEAAAELQALQDELNELKAAEAEKVSTLEKRLGDSTSTTEYIEDEIAYVKSGSSPIDKSPDIKKNNFPVESDEIRASVMESQNIVENDVEKNSEDDESSPTPIVTTGPESLQIPNSTMEKIQAVARKAKEKERNEKIKKNIVQPRYKAPKPTPELISMGPPPKIKPAVCRDIPGSAVDSCGRLSMGGWTSIKEGLPPPGRGKKRMKKLIEKENEEEERKNQKKMKSRRKMGTGMNKFRERRNQEMKSRAEGIRKSFSNWRQPKPT